MKQGDTLRAPGEILQSCNVLVKTVSKPVGALSFSLFELVMVGERNDVVLNNDNIL